MDDKFLYQLREQPDAQFVQDLRAKLSQDSVDYKWRLNMRVFDGLSVNKRPKMAWGMAFAVIGLLAITTILPVRAFIASVVSRIAGQSFVLTEDYPGDDAPNPDIVEGQIMSLEGAVDIFPHSITLPTQVPDGFVLDESNVRVYTGEDDGSFADSIEIKWAQQETLLTLSVTNRTEGSEVIAPDAAEELFLNDEYTAVLIRGGWNYQTGEWDDAWGMIRLRWQLDGLVYDLSGQSDAVTVEQLTEMALSILDQ